MRNGCEVRDGGPARRRHWWLPTMGILLLAAPILVGGCFGVDHQAGDPVNKYQDNHTILVTGDTAPITPPV